MKKLKPKYKWTNRSLHFMELSLRRDREKRMRKLSELAWRELIHPHWTKKEIEAIKATN